MQATPRHPDRIRQWHKAQKLPTILLDHSGPTRQSEWNAYKKLAKLGITPRDCVVRHAKKQKPDAFFKTPGFGTFHWSRKKSVHYLLE